jgi:hypothetical protein
MKIKRFDRKSERFIIANIYIEYHKPGGSGSQLSGFIFYVSVCDYRFKKLVLSSFHKEYNKKNSLILQEFQANGVLKNTLL